MRRHPVRAIAIATFVVTMTALVTATAIGATSSGRSPAGATDPGVTQTTLTSTICATGNTGAVPSVNKKLQARVYAANHVGTSGRKRWVVTTLVPVELGGEVQPDNLVLVRRADVTACQTVVTEAHDNVCSGQVDLTPAQAAFIHGWASTHAEVAPLVEQRRTDVANYVAETQRAAQEQALAEYLASIAPPPTTSPPATEATVAPSGQTPEQVTCQLTNRCPQTVNFNDHCNNPGQYAVTPGGPTAVCKNYNGVYSWQPNV